MEGNFSHIKDDRERKKLQNLYTYATVALFLNLLFIFIPSLWLYWIPYSGHWILFGISIIRAAVSTLNCRFSSQSRGISFVNMLIAYLLFILTLIGAIWREPSIGFSRLSGLSYCSKYPSLKSCKTGNYPAFVILGIVVPIVAFIHMVLFSVNCSKIRNEAINQGSKIQTQQPGVNPHFQQPIHYPYAQAQQFQQQSYSSAHGADPGQQQTMVNVQLSQDQWTAVQQLIASQSEAPQGAERVLF